MSELQQFGGEWTIEKLDILTGYLDAYLIALKYMKFKKIYVDAFAGTGSITTRDGQREIAGSARLALLATNHFDQYYFIEKDKKKASQLQQMVNAEFPELSRRVHIRQGDANTELSSICSAIDWRFNRALLFLDPYATEVSMLYKTGVEYGDYTMNHVQGCSHGCKYPCYAFLMAKRFGKVHSYEEWCSPVLVSNTLELLDKEIPRLKSKIQSVQLCFTTDPFMYGYPEITEMSLKAIRKLNANGIKCTALTKGLLPIELATLSKRNEYGITFISLDESYRTRMEPGAAPYRERLAALKALHDAGCKTWVSIEPYPTPNLIEQNLTELLDAVSFTDKIIFGRTNYNKEISSYKNHKAFYNRCAKQVIAYCEERNIAYHIKNGTLTEQEEHHD